jgi:hypothetical protein
MRQYDIYRYLLRLSITELMDEKDKFNHRSINTFMISYPKMIQNVIDYKLNNPISKAALEQIEISAIYGQDKEVTSIIEAKQTLYRIMVLFSTSMLILIVLNQQFKWFLNSGVQLLVTVIGVFICYSVMQYLLSSKAMKIIHYGMFKPWKNDQF